MRVKAILPEAGVPGYGPFPAGTGILGPGEAGEQGDRESIQTGLIKKKPLILGINSKN
jgi:hypothetical protein